MTDGALSESIAETDLERDIGVYRIYYRRDMFINDETILPFPLQRAARKG